ncbi:MAG: hypothetical protein ACFNTM_06160, partial [Cardiobacterium sp.]
MLTPQDIFQFLAYAAIAALLAGLLVLLITVWTVVYHVSQPGKRLRNNLIATPLALLAAFLWAYIASSDDRARQRKMQAFVHSVHVQMPLRSRGQRHLRRI